jgi:hypothetical protein
MTLQESEQGPKGLACDLLIKTKLVDYFSNQFVHLVVAKYLSLSTWYVDWNAMLSVEMNENANTPIPGSVLNLPRVTKICVGSGLIILSAYLYIIHFVHTTYNYFSVPQHPVRHVHIYIPLRMHIHGTKECLLGIVHK